MIQEFLLPPIVAQIPPHIPTYHQQIEDDTIDLYELWITLWNKKGLVIAVTVIAALGSVVYALLQPPIYKAEALLLPPGTKDIQSLNFPGLQEVTPDGVFAEFKNWAAKTNSEISGLSGSCRHDVKGLVEVQRQLKELLQRIYLV